MAVAEPTSLTLRAMAEQVANAYIPPPHGRPSELADVDKIHTLLTAVAEGMYPTVACSLADISRATLHNWRVKAEEGDKACQGLIDALGKAEAWAEYDQVQNVRRAGKKEQFWAASATHLERRWPDRWGKRNDDTTVAKVIVQFGAMEADITVIQQPAQGNVISYYQTQSLSEGMTSQSLTDAPDVTFASEGGGRKLLPTGEGPAK